jgi:hypothetical protein
VGAEKCRIRELFQMTKHDDRAMAAPAMSGSSRPQAARGMAATL